MTDLPANEPYTGVFPIAPTPFTETGALDPEGQRRVLDCMIDQGVDGICILANYTPNSSCCPTPNATSFWRCAWITWPAGCR